MRSRARLWIQRNETPKPGDPVFAGSEVDARRAAGRCLARGRGGDSRGRLRVRFPRRSRRGRGARGRRRACAHRARIARERAARRHPVRRRVDGHDPRQGPRRAQPGICAGAGDGARRHAGDRRASPPTPTAPTAAPARPTTPPAPSSMATRLRARKALGLDPAAFLADNNSTGFFEALGDLLAPGPTFTNVNDFRAIVVDRP